MRQTFGERLENPQISKNVFTFMHSDEDFNSKINKLRGGPGRIRQTQNARTISILTQLKHISLCSLEKKKTFHPGHLKADLSSNYHTLNQDLDRLFKTGNIILVSHCNRGKTYSGKTYYYLSDKGKETLDFLLAHKF